MAVYRRNTQGLLGCSSRGELTQRAGGRRRGGARRPICARSRRLTIDAIARRSRAVALCHRGRRCRCSRSIACSATVPARRRAGYPNLNDDDWLWGGKVDDDPAPRSSTASASRRRRHPDHLGYAGLRSRRHPQLRRRCQDVAWFVRKSPTRSRTQRRRRTRRDVFADNCAPATARTARAIASSARPKLNDAIWLYGGRAMPTLPHQSPSRAWRHAGLGRAPRRNEVKELAVYVHSLGGGE